MALSRASRQYLGVRALLPPDLQYARRNPTSTDVAYVKGTLWLNLATPTAFMYSGASGVWIALGSGASGGVVTINSLSPTAGNIIIAGTANQITVSSSGSTVTLSVPSTFIAPGSIASTTTVTAGTALVATTSVTAGTSITATLGNITATNGNHVYGTAGNKQIYSSVGSTTTAGANSAGSVALVGGTATVATTAVGASSLIRLTVQALGTVTTAKAVAATAKTAGVSFVITSADATDTSTIFWEIVN